MPLVALGIIGAVGSVAGGAIASSGANKAAQTQSDAAVQAAQIQADQSQKALDFQKQEYATQQAQIAPWLKAGTTAINQLSGMNVPAFQAPTAATEQNDPGYKFRLDQGMQALQNSAAAKGGLLSGNTLKGITDYSQNYASNEYNNVYGRAMNKYNTNVLGPYNRLSALAGVGQQAQAQSAQQGQAAAGNVTNIDLTTGAQQGNAIQQAAAARASGYASGANIWGSTLDNLSSLPMQYMALNRLSGANQFGGAGAGSFNPYGFGPGY